MKKWINGCLAVMLLLGSLVLPKSAAAADKQLIYDQTFRHYASPGGDNTGLPRNIPSGSRDYTMKVYASFPNDAGQTRLLLQLGTDDDSQPYTTVYNQTVAAGFNGWIDMPAIPTNSNGQPYTKYALAYESSRTSNAQRIMRLQVYYQDVTPPTAPTIMLNGPESTWTATPIQVSIKGATDDAGIAKYAYNIDGGAWMDYSGPFTAPAGQHSLTAIAYDNNGLSGDWSRTVRTFYDPEAPTPPSITDFDSSKWYKRFDLRLTPGSGGLSGVRGVMYSLSGATTQARRAYDDRNPQVITANGITTVSAVTWSQADAESQPVTGNIQIDSVPPTGELTAPQDWARSITIHAAGTDSTSGMQSITLPSGDVVAGDQADYPVMANGTYTFTFTDVAGNSSTQSITVSRIDTTAPTKPVIQASHAGWSAAPVQITIGGSTDDSGIARYVYAIDGGSWQNYTGPFSAPTGQHQVIARAYDNAGISSSPSDAVTTSYDPDPPTAPVISGLDSSKWYTRFVLDFVPGTGLSGSSGVYYTLSGPAAQPRRAYDDKQPQTITTDGITTVTATTLSQAGNESSAVTGTIKIDRTPPIGVLTAPQEWAPSVTIHAAGTDVLSGMQSITLPGGKVVAGDQADYLVKDNGTYLFTFTDIAGNTFTKSITIQNIDRQPPSVTVSRNGSDWTSPNLPVTFTFTDAESGLDLNKLYYQWTTSPDSPTVWEQAASSQQTLTLDQEGVWYMHLRAFDRAGNELRWTSAAYHVQRQPQAPMLSVIGKATDQMLLSWPLLSSGTQTDGLTYTVQNETTGQSWTVKYPINQLLDTGLSGGTDYRYRITATNHVGTDHSVSAVTGVTLPIATAHAGVAAIDKDYRQALVSIDPIRSATSYRITATNASTQQVDADVTVTGTTYQVVTGLTPYTMYDFAIRGINASGEGAAYHTSFLSLPDQVNGFTTVQIGADAIDLKWNTVTKAVYAWSSVSDDTYYLLRRDNQLVYRGSDAAYADTGLASGTEYSYAAAAANRTGEGSEAMLRSISTLPAAPTNLRQTGGTSTSVVMSLTPPRGTKGLRLVIDGTRTIHLGTVQGSYTIQGLTAGTTYRLEVYAYNASGFGASATLIASTLPDSPSAGAITVQSLTDHAVTFLVHDIVPGATKYKLSIDGQSYEVSAGEITVPDLTAGTLYDYRFAAGNAAGYGEATAGQVLTLPAAPTNYAVAAHTPTTLMFTWQPVPSAVSYDVLDSTGKLLATVATAAYSATGLTPGATAAFHVRAENASGKGADSYYSFRTLPGFDRAVDDSQLVHVDAVGVHGATLSWVQVPGADQYRVYDPDHQLLQTVTDPSAVLQELGSAARYRGYTIVPFNSTGEGKAMPVPSWVTLPDDAVELSYESTRDQVTLHIHHVLHNEQLVIASQGKELYRGSIQQMQSFTQDRLQAGAMYTFEVWTENELGQASKHREFVTYTEKERGMQPPAPPTEEKQPVITAPEPESVPLITTEDKKKGFIDISRSFAKDSITRLADLGVVQGVSDELYAPQSGTTRAEFMAMLTRLTLTPEQMQQTGSDALTFTDIETTGWYMPELRAALRYGIAKGFSAQRFAPDQAIDREQAAKMLSGALYSLVPETTGDFYTDSAAVSPWAKSEVNGLTVTEVVQGYPDQTFRPHTNLTRAESAAMIDRAMQGGMIAAPSSPMKESKTARSQQGMIK